ncbi:2-phosphosulfolactate phosphatase [Micromonosporaceae bacterium Da 78-11]
MGDFAGQRDYRVRFDWGLGGAAEIAPGAGFVAVVDVLSFTTTLTVAVERGIRVLPYRWADDWAVQVAHANDATLAVGRSQGGPGLVSLSPDSVLRADAAIERLVLPSPNGSAVSAGLAGSGATVVGVCLRNAGAAAAWVRSRAGGRPVAVVAAGEHRPDGSMRPAVEDLWGAGAFLDALVSPLRSAEGAAGMPTGVGATRRLPAAGATGISPEAGAAVAAYRSVAGCLSDALKESASGRELRSLGFAVDVAVAGAANVSRVVPILQDGWFVDGGI